ncbi:MAG: DNA mismatch repair endonuclease MutL [Flavobacteriales bacterium]|nr:DNA mismatch repair endonuclease MutL [Flavobacteriales bacterium]
MHNFIQLLPDHIANQIAAGEVIQRPASVVKELMENAIDAGATKIEVHIKDAGKTLIQVIDNGKGMSETDATLCFARHATSKVRTADDLFSLTTKGFRGEALASIAAISHVEMRTKLEEAETGRKIVIEGSKIITNEDTVSPTGTTFDIKNLFYNVPARRNFLKKDSTEFRHIQDEFERIAFSHPTLQLKLTNNGTEVYNLPPAVLRKRIVNILGPNYNDRLVPIDESTEIVQLKGFVLKPEHAKKTRGDQFFFVNDRYFKSHYFNHAITKAFEGLLAPRTFPGYFLYLTIDPSKIDVNVHPTKTEIKFEEEKFIYSILMSSIRLALGKYNISPTLDFERETSFDLPHDMKMQPAREPSIRVNDSYNPFNTTTSNRTGSGSSGKTQENFSKAITDQGFGSKESSSNDWADFYPIEESKEEEKDEVILFEEEATSTKQFIVKGNYIISSSKSGLMLIHARRAVEQIVYTETFNNFISNPIESQTLLFPITREVSKNEAVYWDENKALLQQLGFTGKIEDQKLEVTAVPSVLQEESISSGIEDIFETIAYQNVEKGDVAHTLIAAIAKSASMKNINFSAPESIQSLIDQLFQCENHSYSPRNKKIIETITLDEIGNKFN